MRFLVSAEFQPKRKSSSSGQGPSSSHGKVPTPKTESIFEGGSARAPQIPIEEEKGAFLRFGCHIDGLLAPVVTSFI